MIKPRGESSAENIMICLNLILPPNSGDLPPAEDAPALSGQLHLADVVAPAPDDGGTTAGAVGGLSGVTGHVAHIDIVVSHLQGDIAGSGEGGGWGGGEGAQFVGGVEAGEMERNFLSHV